MQTKGNWTYAYYAETNIYIGVNDSDEVWIQGDVFDGSLYIDKLSHQLEKIKTINPDTFPRGDYSYLKTYLSWMIKKEMVEQNAEGLSIAIVDDQQVVWSQGFGFADTANKIKATPETVYRTGSISKLFTDTLVMQLAEQGKIDIDQPLKTYLPEFSIKTRFSDAGSITPRNVMTHHSGLLGDMSNGGFTKTPAPFRPLIDQLKDECVAYPPNTILSYSNVGITLLGAMIEDVTGKDFNFYVEQQLLKPIGMKNASFSAKFEGDLYSKAYDNHVEKIEFPDRDVPAGGLNSNVLDLSAFIKMILAEGNVNGQQLINPETLKEMLRPQNKELVLDMGAEIGLGWFIENDNNIGKIVSHDGAMLFHRSQLSVSPEHKLGVVVLSNSPGDQSVEKIARAALKLVVALKIGQKQQISDVIEPTETTRALSSAEVKKYTGQYVTPFGLLNMNSQGDELKVEVDGMKLESKAQDDGKFVFTGVEGAFELKTMLGYDLVLYHLAEEMMIFGEKIKPAPISSAWKNRLGKYEVTNLENEIESLAPKNVVFREKDGVLIAGLSIDSDNLQLPLQPLSDTEAIILGIGRGKRETIRIVTINGKEQIAYSGYLFSKK
ncbi:MAG: beta-lactamase family protein [Methylococcales bacterium]|nr:beta-lactamase family protein [Methylococcales bacterium]